MNISREEPPESNPLHEAPGDLPPAPVIQPDLPDKRPDYPGLIIIILAALAILNHAFLVLEKSSGKIPEIFTDLQALEQAIFEPSLARNALIATGILMFLCGLAGFGLWILAAVDRMYFVALVGLKTNLFAKREDPQLPPWTAWEALKLLSAWILMMYWFSYLVGLLAGESGGAMATAIAALLSYAVALPLVFWFIARRTARPGESLGWRFDEIGQAVRVGICGYCMVAPVLYGTSLFWGLFLSRVLGLEIRSQEQALLILNESNGWGILLFALLGTVAAPIMEETMFRGLLQSSLKKRLGLFMAVLLTSAIFSLVHTNVLVFPPILILGMFLGYAYEHGGSLLSSMIIHALNNGMSLTLLICVKALMDKG